MKRRPEFTDMIEAARVSSFMEDAEAGRWRIRHFSISKRRYALELLAAQMENNEQADMAAQRTVPPGDYVCLTRKATPMELKDIEEEHVTDSFSPDGDPKYVPIMSDTPAEIREHGEALGYAYGRVVITGLGLGVVVSALLANPDIEHITVVEIDKDVIALTAPYYEDEPRVTIVADDALRFARTYEGEDFDYAWHDIWSHIADRNLDDDDLAEHGISYSTMFEAFSSIAVDQGAWAHREALEMQRAKTIMKEREAGWARRFIDATDDEVRLDLLEEFHMRRMLPQIPRDQPIPDDIRAYLNENYDVRDNAWLQLQARGGTQMAEEFKAILSADETYDPLDRPNDVPEANVAR